MRRAFLISAALASVIVAMAATSSEARERRARDGNVVRVTPRNFLDAGKVAPVGSMSRYATDQILISAPYNFNRDSFGEGALPGFIGAGPNPFGSIDFRRP
jgi:hypothetical protein